MSASTVRQGLIPASSLRFLSQIKNNNDRDWFQAHKDTYLQELEHIAAFAEELLNRLNRHDVIETESGKKSLHRIYRDTRFSKEKTPYKINWSGSYSRATKWRRGSYYFHLQPGGSFVSGGFWGPVPEDLKLIRDEIAYDPKSFRKILKQPAFLRYFGSLEGEQLKTTPKGFAPDDPAIDLLRYKQFRLVRHFTDKEVLSPGFLQEVDKTFKAMRPFLDYMTQALTVDSNGEAMK